MCWRYVICHGVLGRDLGRLALTYVRDMGRRGEDLASVLRLAALKMASWIGLCRRSWFRRAETSISIHDAEYRASMLDR